MDQAAIRQVSGSGHGRNLMDLPVSSAAAGSRRPSKKSVAAAAQGLDIGAGPPPSWQWTAPTGRKRSRRRSRKGA